MVGTGPQSTLNVGANATRTPSVPAVGDQAGKCDRGSPLSDSRGCSAMQLQKESEAIKHMISKTTALRTMVVVFAGLLRLSFKFV